MGIERVSRTNAYDKVTSSDKICENSATHKRMCVL